MYLIHYQKQFIHTYHYFIHAYHYVHFLKITSTKWHEICTFSVLQSKIVANNCMLTTSSNNFQLSVESFSQLCTTFKPVRIPKIQKPLVTYPQDFSNTQCIYVYCPLILTGFQFSHDIQLKTVMIDLLRHVKGSLQLMSLPKRDQSYSFLIPVMTKLSTWR